MNNSDFQNFSFTLTSVNSLFFAAGYLFLLACLVVSTRKSRHYKKQNEKLVDQLSKQTKMASLGEMAGGIAHEINSPLAIIRGQAELLEHELSNDNKRLQTIIKTVDRIAQIVVGLRSFTRDNNLEAFTDVKATELVNETLYFCQEKIKLSSIKIITEVSADILINCRRTQISQVILNLVSNSYDAIKDATDLKEKWIKIKATKNPNHVTIQIIDSGLGISDDVVEKIMNPFFTTKPVNLGTGLGLSISKDIAEAHGGSLLYSPQDGHTCFNLTIPTTDYSV